jgi:hypothetical protein
MTTDQQRIVAIVLLVLGVIALVLGVIYLTVEAKSLPSFMGQIHGYTHTRSHRGVGGVIVGAVLLLGGVALLAYKPRRTT